MCYFGNCKVRDTILSITCADDFGGKTRKRFCSFAHAAAWSIEQEIKDRRVLTGDEQNQLEHSIQQLIISKS
jgi:hypothetical protein